MDRDILRSLAGQIAQIAALDVQKETERLYRGVNSLKMIRPVVLLDELPWNRMGSRSPKMPSRISYFRSSSAVSTQTSGVRSFTRASMVLSWSIYR